MSKNINLEELVETLGPKFADRIAELDSTDEFVAENYDELKEAKVFSAQIPQDLGGGGASHSEMCAFLRALAHHCSSTALAVAMHQHLVAAAIVNHQAGRPGKALLEKVAGAEAILISTGANDWLESNGNAQKVEGGYRVSAVKPFTSGSPVGTAFVTSAAHDDPVEGPQVLHFPVPANADGVVFLDDWETLGMRATGSQTVRFEEVFVPEEAVALKRTQGEFHPAFNVILTVALPLIMSVYVGAAEAACAIARAQARKRLRDPVTPFLVGEMENLLTTAQLACDDLVRLANDFDFEPSQDLSSTVLIRKTIVAKHVIAAAEKAMEVSGGAGFFRKTGIERLLRDVHAAQFHPMTEKRQQLFTGRLSIGLDPVDKPANAKMVAE
ncbi:acyl-CoA dehydrogenase family protein [Ruegeria sp. HKCCD7255]|uniref:acyl-CoA dehydrogenase family protein n=1 Tax=Ruegeria sp. HKCCD7255 TaxID=2683004 RepID=UPI001488CCFF|nr:acyl-CoA dehydrogenase family protein [Ruegeria sp. HKCCD7255]